MLRGKMLPNYTSGYRPVPTIGLTILMYWIPIRKRIQTRGKVIRGPVTRKIFIIRMVLIKNFFAGRVKNMSSIEIVILPPMVRGGRSGRDHFF